MPRNLKFTNLRSSIQKRTEKHFAFWSNRISSNFQEWKSTETSSEDSVSSSQISQFFVGLQRSNSSSPQRQLKNEKGFAYLLLISLLPVILSAGFFLLFSQFLQKNWMQALHTCRAELLQTQKRTGQHLDHLLKLNWQVKALRASMIKAQAELAYAAITFNGPLAAKATAEIARIRRLQQGIDKIQKGLILMANFEMSSGSARIMSRLKTQSLELQSRLPEFFSFRIHSIRAAPVKLAVKPDSSDVAPVYELLPQFSEKQALTISWISEFHSSSTKGSQWLVNQHQKKDSCSATLKEEKSKFSEILKEDKSSWRL